MTSSNSTIAKNTLFLYVRTFAIMIISLFTSRVILQVLGIDDYGIYQAVGGIVGFMSFINSALSGGTSRFLTYELGTGNNDRLKNTFSTTLTVHIILAFFIVFTAETLGLWYFKTKMVIPYERFYAATWVFHLSIITSVVTIISVPYNAIIIAHEKMKVFAYVGIVDAASRLAIVYLLKLGDIDKLVLYAIMLMVLQIAIFLFNVVYCKNAFPESKYKLFFVDKPLFKEIFSFSGWGLFAGGSIALNSQGVLLLLNYFFAPAIVTARSISLQVYNAANQFVNNFRTAANPQIVKQLAAGDTEGSHRLLLQSTIFSYYLMLILCVPICLLAAPLLNIWLVEVPDYAVSFLQLAIIQSLFQVFDTSFYTALYAKGRIRENALISPTIGFLRFPLVFFLFKMGCSPLALSWTSIATSAILGCLIKPILIVRIADYSMKEVLKTLYMCFRVTLLAVPIPLATNLFLDVNDSLWHSAVVLVVSILSVASSVWFIGMTRNMKQVLMKTARAKLKLTFF